MTDDKQRGLYPKYYVQKIVDHDLLEVHDWVFVLNPTTDPGARFALLAYAVWCEKHEYYQLAEDIREKIGHPKLTTSFPLDQ